MTNKQYSLNYEILSSIDKINDCVMESEVNVMNALLNSYEKALMIMENCSETTDLSSFSIIQEAFIMEDGEDSDNDETAPTETKQESIIITIPMFIPRLIMGIIKFIKSKWDNRRVKRLEKDIDALKKLNAEQKKEFDERISELSDRTNTNASNINKEAEESKMRHESLKDIVDMNDRYTRKRDDKHSDDIYTNKREIERLKLIIDNNDKKQAEILNKERSYLLAEIRDGRHRANHNFNKIQDRINLQTGYIKTAIDCHAINDVINISQKLFDILRNVSLMKPGSFKGIKYEYGGRGLKTGSSSYAFNPGDNRRDDYDNFKIDEFKGYISRTSSIFDKLIKDGTEISNRLNNELKMYNSKKIRTKFKSEDITNLKKLVDALNVTMSELHKTVELLNYEMDTVIHITEFGLKEKLRLL